MGIQPMKQQSSSNLFLGFDFESPVRSSYGLHRKKITQTMARIICFQLTKSLLLLGVVLTVDWLLPYSS